jgi:hypothetical protein
MTNKVIRFALIAGALSGIAAPWLAYSGTPLPIIVHRYLSRSIVTEAIKRDGHVLFARTVHREYLNDALFDPVAGKVSFHMYHTLDASIPFHKAVVSMRCGTDWTASTVPPAYQTGPVGTWQVYRTKRCTRTLIAHGQTVRFEEVGLNNEPLSFKDRLYEDFP